MNASHYHALANLRYLIRGFLSGADAAARRAGLEPQQYQLMLAIRGLLPGSQATVQVLAERLALRHNTTVELIDRMEKHGYVARSRRADDRRCALVSLLPQGERFLARVARERLVELRTEGPALIDAMNALLDPKHNRRAKKHKARSGTRQKTK